MNPPLSAAAPTVTTPKPARARNADEIDLDVDIDVDLEAIEDEASYRPAHAAHARPATDEAAVLDLTEITDSEDAGADDVVRVDALDGIEIEIEHTGTSELVVLDDDSADSPTGAHERVTVVDDVIVVDDDTRTNAATIAGDEAVMHGPALPAEPVIGARAAARAARRRRPRTDEAVAATPTADTVQWSSTPADTRAEEASVGATSARTAPAAERDPLGLIRAIDGAWTAASCWVRRNATAQMVVPFLVVVSVGLVAVIAAEGATQRIGQIIVTAALVTAGVAWAQAIGDQRRRQHDLRFRLASGNLERADLTGTVLDGFTLWGQNLRGAKLSGCSADHVLLSGADLREASLTGASLRVASLAGADLSNARVFRSDLRGADLTDAIAVSTSFEGAVLRGALLEGADLSGADLSGADLRGATHDDRTNWTGVIVSDDTHLPEGAPVLQG